MGNRGHAVLDVGDRRVDLERLSDCDAALGADVVNRQTGKGGGNKNGFNRMLLPFAVTKIQSPKWG